MVTGSSSLKDSTGSSIESASPMHGSHDYLCGISGLLWRRNAFRYYVHYRRIISVSLYWNNGFAQKL
jgi:hypothetical protein